MTEELNVYEQDLKIIDFATPLKTNAFEMDDETKISLITDHFTSILNIKLYQ